MADCPVCGRIGLEATQRECPQCNADLECFQLLETLHDEEACAKIRASQGTGGKSATESVAEDEVRWKPHTRRLTALFATALLLLGLMGAISFYQNLLVQEAERGALMAERIRLNKRVVHVEQQLSNLMAMSPSKKFSINEGKQLSERALYVEQQLSHLLARQMATSPSKPLSKNREKLLLRSSRRLTHIFSHAAPLD